MTALTTEQVTHAGEELKGVLDSKIGAAVSSTQTYDPPAVAAAGYTTQVFTVTGAVLGDIVLVSFDKDLAGMVLSAYVSATNTVTIVLHNLTAGSVNLASGTLKFRLVR